MLLKYFIDGKTWTIPHPEFGWIWFKISCPIRNEWIIRVTTDRIWRYLDRYISIEVIASTEFKSELQLLRNMIKYSVEELVHLDKDHND